MSLRQTPSSVPVRLVAGPPGTWAVGFADGVVGLWSGESGLPLRKERLNGSVIHIAFVEDTLYAATSLGDHLSWELQPFFMKDCELMREVWKQIPVVWSAPRALLRDTPKSHRCAP